MMAKELRPLDISHTPELLHLVEEIRKGDEPRVLRRGSEDLAILTPLKTLPRRKATRTRTEADHEALLSSAGIWDGIVDTDKLIADIYGSRRRSFRPPVDL